MATIVRAYICSGCGHTYGEHPPVQQRCMGCGSMVRLFVPYEEPVLPIRTQPEPPRYVAGPELIPEIADRFRNLDFDNVTPVTHIDNAGFAGHALVMPSEIALRPKSGTGPVHNSGLGDLLASMTEEDLAWMREALRRTEEK